MQIDIGSKKGVVVLPVFTDKKLAFFDEKKNKQLKEAVRDELASYHFEGKKEETLFLKAGNEKILLIGINKECTAEDVRRSYSVVLKTLKARKETSATLEVPKETDMILAAVVEGLNLSDYKFNKYVSKKDDEPAKISLYLDIDARHRSLIEETLTITNNVNSIRTLINENSNVMTPQKIAETVSSFAKKNKLQSRILDEKDIQKEGLNLLSAVGSGSQYPPRLIIAEYDGDPKSKERLALVGKGITFDTGGTNLKPTGSIEDMKDDKAGALICFGAFMTAVEMKLKKNLILVIPSAENSLSGHSYKPGDAFIAHNGTSVEIANTDAEGRLVLADAISYVQKNYDVTEIIDMATLTGAIIVALGTNTIGMFGNDATLKKKLVAAGEATFERVWELPIYDDHRDLIKSKFADIKNYGGRDAGSITAAAFIEKFIIEGTKWIHLDIAGVDYATKENYYVSELATGKGLRLLVEFLRRN